MPKKTKKSEQISKDEQVLTFANNILTEARHYKNSETIAGSSPFALYQKSIRYFKGEQPRKDEDWRVWNKFAEVFENRVAHITAQHPKWKFRPQAEDDLISADVLNQVLTDVLWDKEDLEYKSEISLWEMAFGGSVHIKTLVGEDLWPKFKVCKCGSILTDKVTDINDARYIIHLFYLGVNDIKSTYNVDVQPEAELGEKDPVGTFENPMLSYYGSDDYEMPSQITDDNSGVAREKWITDAIGRALVAEVYVEDPAWERIPFEPEEVNAEHQRFKVLDKNAVPHPKENHPQHILYHTAYLNTLDPGIDIAQMRIIQNHIKIHEQYPQEEKRKKYPRGRVITFCPNQNKLLYDRPNRTPLHWKEMWVKADFIPLPDSWWGKGLGFDLFDPQDSFNHRKNAVTQNIDLLNNGIVKMTVGLFNSLRGNLKKISNLIGRIVKVRHKDDLTVDYGSAMPQHVFQDMFHTESFIDRQPGQNDVLSGRLPGSDTAGVTVDALLSQSMKRINLPVKHWAMALQKMGRNAVKIMDAVTPGDEIIRIIGKDGPYPVQWEQLRGQFGVENIRIDIQQFLGTNRQEKLKEAIQLYAEGRGVYDRQAVLERLDDPDKWNILKRQSEIAILSQRNQMLEDFAQKAGSENERLKQNIAAMEEKNRQSKESKPKG